MLTVPEIFHLLLEHRHRADGAAQGVEEHKYSSRSWASLTGCVPSCWKAREPSFPKRWGELNTVTIAFGHGIAVAPPQAVMGTHRRAG